MPIDWTPLVDFTRQAKSFLITTHVRPDPDGIGSQMGLARVLEAMGKTTHLVISSVWPPRYTFMDPDRRIARFELPGDAYRHVDGIIIVDTGTWNQLGEFGDFLKTLTCPKFVIDHHVTQDGLGATLLVDTAAEATGRLIYELVRALDQPLTPEVANALFAAVATDTGWFRHANTTPATYGLAEKLVAAGARPTHLYELLYEQSNLSRMHLQGLVLNRMALAHGGQTAYSEVCRDDYEATGAIPSDTEELVNFPRSIAGVKVAMIFMEQPAGGVKISFRSREPISVAKIAETFGGGGHRLAAGAILQTSLGDAKAQVLAAVSAALSAVPAVER